MIEDIKNIIPELASPKDIVLISHRNPDGDAIGSSLAVRAYLQSKGHFVKALLPSEHPENYNWLSGIEDLLVYDLHPEKCLEAIAKAEIIVGLDFNALDRIDKMGMAVQENTKAFKVLMDHHLDPEPFADYYYCDDQASSTCELVYYFIRDMGDEAMIKGSLAESIYTGIITDTGSFHHATTPELFSIVGKMKERGLDDTQLQNNIFNNQTEKQMRLLGFCLNKRMTIDRENGIGLIYLTKKDYDYFKIGRGDTEGIINYLLKINVVKLAALITAQPRIVKLSLRSKNDISVQALARDHFNGGGHFNASGGYMHSSLGAVINKFWEEAPRYTK